MSTPTAASKIMTDDRPAERQPVNILPDQVSYLVGNLHPVLLLSLLFFSFKSLVRSPSSTLLGLAPTIAIIQMAYCVICLPTAPSESGKAAASKKKAKPTQDWSFRLVPAFLSLVLTITLSAPLLFIIVILFGGPMVSDTQQTVLLALHFALLTSPQLFYTHGLDTKTWLSIASLQLPLDEVYGMSLGACLGAWIGAIPIPLDWDRDWQRWPVTIVTGVYIGAVIGKLAGGYMLKGVRMKIT